MGHIYHYSCSNCDKIDGSVFYGIGMMFPITNTDTRLFGCDDCGEVFSRNINLKFNRCPKCRKKPKELEFFETDEIGITSPKNTKISCPNCKVGEIKLEGAGCWD